MTGTSGGRRPINLGIQEYRPDLDDMNLQLVDRTDSPTDGAEQAEMTALLTAAVDRLEPIYQEIVVLRVFLDLSYKEISDLTGCNESTARSRMELAVKQLRRLLSVRKTARAKRGSAAGEVKTP